MVTARPLRKPRQLKVFLIAGEASGDAYGAHLIRELNTACQFEGLNLETVGWGGDAMNGEGMRLLTHFTSSKLELNKFFHFLYLIFLRQFTSNKLK